MRSIVVIPTYNEQENIGPLIHAIFDLRADLDILVVDDNSPDGTGRTVEALREKLYRLHVLHRAGKQGLARAYIAGMQWSLDQGYDVIIQMDADFSHRPADLKKMVEARENFDGVIGSRYVPGGSTANWGLVRRLISRGGSLYARLILQKKLWDWTGGFNLWRKPVLEQIGLENLRSDGYSFQIELKYRALQKGFRLKEVPILFEDRRVGHSKMNFSIVLEALYRVWTIRLGAF